MENEIDKQNNLREKIERFFFNNKRTLVSLFILFLLILISFSYFSYSLSEKNKKMSELFIKAGIFLSLDDKEKSKELYKKIIISKNKFYSPLSLNYIIDNQLDTPKEILKLFKYIEDIKLENEQKNLIKLKKALLLIDLQRQDEGEKLLKEMISENSVWKDTALEILE